MPDPLRFEVSPTDGLVHTQDLLRFQSGKTDQAVLLKLEWAERSGTSPRETAQLQLTPEMAFQLGRALLDLAGPIAEREPQGRA